MMMPSGYPLRLEGTRDPKNLFSTEGPAPPVGGAHLKVAEHHGPGSPNKGALAEVQAAEASVSSHRRLPSVVVR